MKSVRILARSAAWSLGCRISLETHSAVASKSSMSAITCGASLNLVSRVHALFVSSRGFTFAK